VRWFAAKLVLVKMSATQKWNPIEDMFLEPFQPEINYRCDVEGEQLGNHQAADDNETEWAP